MSAAASAVSTESPQPVMPLGRTVIFDLQSWSFEENSNSGLSFLKLEAVWDKGGKLKSVCMIRTFHWCGSLQNENPEFIPEHWG